MDFQLRNHQNQQYSNEEDDIFSDDREAASMILKHSEYYQKQQQQQQKQEEVVKRPPAEAFSSFAFGVGGGEQKEKEAEEEEEQFTTTITNITTDLDLESGNTDNDLIHEKRLKKKKKKSKKDGKHRKSKHRKKKRTEEEKKEGSEWGYPASVYGDDQTTDDVDYERQQKLSSKALRQLERRLQFREAVFKSGRNLQPLDEEEDSEEEEDDEEYDEEMQQDRRDGSSSSSSGSCCSSSSIGMDASGHSISSHNDLEDSASSNCSFTDHPSYGHYLMKDSDEASTTRSARSLFEDEFSLTPSQEYHERKNRRYKFWRKWGWRCQMWIIVVAFFAFAALIIVAADKGVFRNTTGNKAAEATTSASASANENENQLPPPTSTPAPTPHPTTRGTLQGIHITNGGPLPDMHPSEPPMEATPIVTADSTPAPSELPSPSPSESLTASPTAAQVTNAPTTASRGNNGGVDTSSSTNDDDAPSMAPTMTPTRFSLSLYDSTHQTDRPTTAPVAATPAATAEPTVSPTTAVPVTSVPVTSVPSALPTMALTTPPTMSPTMVPTQQAQQAQEDRTRPLPPMDFVANSCSRVNSPGSNFHNWFFCTYTDYPEFPNIKSSLSTVCPTSNEAPTPESCICIVGVDPYGDSPEMQMCNSCTLSPDGPYYSSYDCSNLITGDCVGKDEQGNCISNN